MKQFSGIIIIFLAILTIVLTFVMGMRIGGQVAQSSKPTPSTGSLQTVTPTNPPMSVTVNRTPTSNEKLLTTYTDKTYGYSLSYPKNWVLDSGNDAEGDPQVRLRRNDSKKSGTTSRVMPELYIVTYGPYSTAGSICSNQGCNENDYQITLSIRNRSLHIPVTRATYGIGDNQQFDFYAFGFDLPQLSVVPSGYSDPIPVRAVASFTTKEDGEEIAQILSTMSFK